MSTHYREISDGMADVFRTTLHGVDPDWTVEARYRQTVRAGVKTRNDIMGDPIKYTRILFLGDVEDSSRFESLDLADRAYEGAYSFIVQGWRKFDDTDDGSYVGSSQEDWDDTIWDPAPEDDPNGLIPLLRSIVGFEITSSGVYVHIDQPTDVTNDIREIGDQVAHYFEFNVIAAAEP